MMTWTDEQINSWCLAFQTYRGDNSAIKKAREIQVQRHPARQEMLIHLKTFLDGYITLQDFSGMLQQHTHPDWNLFGIQGLSGSTFLNKLVKHIPHRDQLTQQLRSALILPKDARDGQHWMQALLLFLEGIIATGQMNRSQLQPARLPFFLSTWWHIQDEEQWPRFTGDLRQRILAGFPVTDPTSSQINVYFSFRERFLVLKKAFGISAWELEYFLLWQSQQEQEKEKAMTSTSQKGKRVLVLNEASRRLQLQWLLAKIGRKVGCQVWIAGQDHQKTWNNEILGQLSISVFPDVENAPREDLLENIAVLWLQKEEVIAAYEIVPKDGEMVVSILRLYDLGLSRTTRRTRLCLVLPQGQFEGAYYELSRPLFRLQQEKHQCVLIDENNLLQNGEHIIRWATDPAVIEDLIRFSNEA